MATEAEVSGGFVTVNGLRIHYVDWGNPEARPLILLHGLRSFAHNWDAVAEAFRNDYHVLALDQRGRGDSDWDPDARYYTQDYVSDLAGFIDQMSLSGVTLAGHSMGGATVLVYASEHPSGVDAIVVEDMGPRAATPSPGGQRIAGELDKTPPGFESWAAAEAFLRAERPHIAEDALRLRLANTLREIEGGRVIWKLDIQGIVRARQNASDATQVDLWPHVRSLQCPTLVLRGANSDTLAWETAQAMAAANDRIKAVQVPGATHYVHDDNLAVFVAEVGAFLSAHARVA